MSAQRNNGQFCITGYRSALRAAFFLIVSCELLTVLALAQTEPTPSRDPTPEAAREERELNEARRSNEKAQADYYRAQTEKLQQPNPPKTFWRVLSDNAAILGALTAALVALFTLVVNQRTALRGRKDTEFYEALKRFGDKDSPTVRASAVAMLTEMSDISFFAWRWRKKAPWWRPDQNMIRYPYFETVLDQLVTGLLIEENSVVIHTIDTALKRIMPRDFKRASDRLRMANLRLQVDLTAQLAEFFVAKGATKANEVKAEDLKEVAILTRCPAEPLKVILDASPEDLWKQSLLKYKSDKIKDLAQKQSKTSAEGSNTLVSTEATLARAIQDRLTNVGHRFLQNVKLCEMLLNARPESATESLDFSGAYLPNVSLLNLRNINFSFALMPRAHFGGANLGGASFEYAVLKGSIFYHNELTDTKLYGAQIDAFQGNWWRADYREQRRPVSQEIIDEGLIEKYILHKGELSPEQLNEAHPSVKMYIAKRNTSREGCRTV